MAHVERPPHAADVPVHVTLRARREVGFLRSEVVLGRVRSAFSRGQREDFRIVAFSVQRDHVHLIVEAEGSSRLRSGLQGLTTRLARAINAALRRRGRVWADRYHRHDLTNPTEVRRAFVYVLQNGRKHGDVRAGALDPASSASLFFGWNAEGEALRVAMGPPAFVRAPLISLPRTWLAGMGWLTLGGGPLDPREAPRPRHRVGGRKEGSLAPAVRPTTRRSAPSAFAPSSLPSFFSRGLAIAELEKVLGYAEAGSPTAEFVRLAREGFAISFENPVLASDASGAIYLLNYKDCDARKVGSTLSEHLAAWLGAGAFNQLDDEEGQAALLGAVRSHLPAWATASGTNVWLDTYRDLYFS